MRTAGGAREHLKTSLIVKYQKNEGNIFEKKIINH